MSIRTRQPPIGVGVTFGVSQESRKTFISTIRDCVLHCLNFDKIPLEELIRTLSDDAS